MDRRIARRQVLAAALAAHVVAACGGSVTQGDVTYERGTLSSRHWPGATVPWRVARPRRAEAASAASAAAPVVVVLHGKGGNADHAFSIVHADAHIAATGLAVASINGGDLYWHARRVGIDTGAMVVDDFLPLLASMGLTTTRVGLLGWSMGGYGSLHLAAQLGPPRVFGVAAESAALWVAPGESAAGAFDDREDFLRHDVFTQRNLLRKMAIRLDCGLSDPFVAANRAFAAGLPDADVNFDAGGHTGGYWAGHAGAQLRWLASRAAYPA